MVPALQEDARVHSLGIFLSHLLIASISISLSLSVTPPRRASMDASPILL
jgi:hypothetical protein